VVATASSLSDESRRLIPDYHSCRTILQRERSSSIPKLPKTLKDIVLEGEWAQTLSGASFLLPHENNEMLIFTCNDNLKFLSKCETIYVDGTFKSYPKLYTQLYSMHGLYGGFVVPLVYTLLLNKSSTTYYNMFGKVRDAMSRLNLVFNPKFIISDFESSLPEAILLQFPNASHVGCHFHFGQALWRKVQDAGLATHYRDKPSIRSFVELCNALAFIPVDEVISKFDNLCFLLSIADSALMEPFYYTSKILGSMVHFQLKCGANMAATGIIGQIMPWRIGMEKLTSCFQRTPTFIYSLVPLSKTNRMS